MNTPPTLLLSGNEPPARVFTSGELKACEQEGKCCRCRACCLSMQVNNMPLPDGKGGVLLQDDGTPESATKKGGEFCWHLKDDGSCGIYTSEHRPKACDAWHGNNPDHHLRMRRGLYNLLVLPADIGVTANAKVLIRTGAMKILSANPHFDEPVIPGSLMAGMTEFRCMLGRYLIELGLFDEEIFETVGVGNFIAAVREKYKRTMPLLMQTVINMNLRYDHDPHRQFVERYFLHDEQQQIWTTAV